MHEKVRSVMFLTCPAVAGILLEIGVFLKLAGLEKASCFFVVLAMLFLWIDLNVRHTCEFIHRKDRTKV